ncbi:MAG TPA: hypothetical protein VNF29_16255 [Candidatus Binataceae bacterium]|nr:hypothetical protein [Candidatus Binataceae bacterium]
MANHNVIGEAVRKAVALVSDPALRPEGRAIAALSQAQDAPIAEGREAAAVSLIEQYGSALQLMIAGGEPGAAFDARRGEFSRALFALREPLAPSNPWPQVAPELDRLKWHSIELDFVGEQIKRGAKPGRIDATGIELDGEFLSREMIRERARPATFRNSYVWNAQFSAIPKN